MAIRASAPSTRFNPRAQRQRPQQQQQQRPQQQKRSERRDAALVTAVAESGSDATLCALRATGRPTSADVSVEGLDGRASLTASSLAGVLLAAGVLSAAPLSAELLLPPAAGASSGPTLQGQARVVDGDTLVVDGTRIRLFGVDAPESKQVCRDALGKEYLCGKASAAALETKIAGRAVACDVVDTDQYGRSVAACRAGGEDLNGWLVDNGFAVAYRQYAKQYGPAEDAARADKRGIWQGAFTTPSEWRKQVKAAGAGAPLPPAPPLSAMATVAAPPLALPAPAAGAAERSCADGAPPAIKGNIGKGGNKLYHVPGGRSYGLVKIDTDAGERYFCSAADAEAAGWKAAPM